MNVTTTCIVIITVLSNITISFIATVVFIGVVTGIVFFLLLS